MMNPLATIDKLAGLWLDWRVTRLAQSQARSEGVPEPEVLAINFSKNAPEFEVILSHPFLAALAEESCKYLQAYNAQNFVQMELLPRIDRGQRAIVFTVAYKDGEMPAAKAARFERQLASLYRRIAAIHPGHSPEPGLYLACEFCGQQIEEDPGNHAPDCLWVEATEFLKKNGQKP